MPCGFNDMSALSRIHLLKVDHCLARDPRDDTRSVSKIVWRWWVVCGGVVSRCPGIAPFKTNHLECIFCGACCAVTRDPVTREHAIRIVLGTPSTKTTFGTYSYCSHSTLPYVVHLWHRFEPEQQQGRHVCSLRVTFVI